MQVWKPSKWLSFPSYVLTQRYHISAVRQSHWQHFSWWAQSANHLFCLPKINLHIYVGSELSKYVRSRNNALGPYGKAATNTIKDEQRTGYLIQRVSQLTLHLFYHLSHVTKMAISNWEIHIHLQKRGTKLLSLLSWILHISRDRQQTLNCHFILCLLSQNSTLPIIQYKGEYSISKHYFRVQRKLYVQLKMNYHGISNSLKRHPTMWMDSKVY